MPSKEEKVKDINAAIHRSSTAMKSKAKAELLKDGRIQYSIQTTTRGGKLYRIKVSFMNILSLLYGEDMRQLHRKYGR